MPTEVCTACQRNLRFTRKYNCNDCQRGHCSNCIRKGSDDKRRCPHCHILHSPPLIREFLLALPTVVLSTHAQAKGIPFVRPIAKEDLVAAILEDQVTLLNEQLEVAKRQVLQCSVNSSTVVSSLTSTPTLSAGTTTDGGEPSTLQGHLLVLPEPVEESSEVQSVSPPSNGEGSSGTGAVGGGGKGSGNFRAGVLVDVGTQTWPTVDSVQSCNSVCSLQLPGQTDSIWQSEETRPHIEKRFATDTTPTVDDIDCVEDIRHLSVRQLKVILVRNYVDIKGCVERSELEERLKMLWGSRKREKEHLAKAAGTLVQDEILCKICMDSPVDCVFLECGHMVTCVMCGKQMNECPICRQYVVRVVRTFRI